MNPNSNLPKIDIDIIQDVVGNSPFKTENVHLSIQGPSYARLALILVTFCAFTVLHYVDFFTDCYHVLKGRHLPSASAPISYSRSLTGLITPTAATLHRPNTRLYHLINATTDTAYFPADGPWGGSGAGWTTFAASSCNSSPLETMPLGLKVTCGPDAVNAHTGPIRYVTGTTILIVNYQQHIPHFAEGLFAAVSEIIALPDICEPQRHCNILLHQFERWSEQTEGSTRWHDAAMAVAADAVKTVNVTISYLNPDLQNLIGKAGSTPPGTQMLFDNLFLLPGGRWFDSSAGCEVFRQAAWEFVSKANTSSKTTGSEGAGPRIAILQRHLSRNLVNIDELEALLTKRFNQPVARVSFEGHSFVDQVAAMRHLKLLVAPHGAALTNIAFMPTDSAVIEVFPIHYHPANYFDLLATRCGLWYGSYDNHLPELAVMSGDCDKLFPKGKPLPTNCEAVPDCQRCCKNSGTIVNITQLDSLLQQAQAYLQTVNKS